MNRLERALEVLAALGKPAARPNPIAVPGRRAPTNAVCKLCSAQIVWANTPHGGRVPLDRHPSGDLALVDGVAVEFGPAHTASSRFVRHFAACRKAQADERAGRA